MSEFTKEIVRIGHAPRKSISQQKILNQDLNVVRDKEEIQARARVSVKEGVSDRGGEVEEGEKNPLQVFLEKYRV